MPACSLSRYEQGDYARTAAALRRLLAFYSDTDGTRPGLLHWLGGCCVQLGLYAEARTHYEAVVAAPAASEDEKSAAASQVLWCWAAVAYQDRDYRTARELFGRLLANNPDDDGHRHGLLLWLGHVHYSLREYGQARDCYEEVLTSAWASDDDRAMAEEWADWSVAQLTSEAGRHAEAAARLERLLARYAEDEPDRCAALLLLGACYEALGAAAGARECYDSVLGSPHASEEQEADARRRLGRQP